MPPPARRTTRRAAAQRGKIRTEGGPGVTMDSGNPIQPVNTPPHEPAMQPMRGPRADSVILDEPRPVDWGRLAAEALERTMAAPLPSSYRAEWWPAHVRFPDLETPARLAKVYATREGLYVYTRAPGQNDRANGGTPHWYARLLYDKTPRPVTGYAARNAGIALNTEVGQVVLTQLGGCGCSNGTLRAWRPAWAGRLEAWEA